MRLSLIRRSLNLSMITERLSKLKTIVLPIDKEYRAPRCVWEDHAGCLEASLPSLFFCQDHQYAMDGDEAKREEDYGSNDAA